MKHSSFSKFTGRAGQLDDKLLELVATLEVANASAADSQGY
jgi:hypothetical protein